MCSSIPCPLCSLPAFANSDSLRLALVSVSTRHLACPICAELLLGLDKLTIHMFGHLHGLVLSKSSSDEFTNFNKPISNNRSRKTLKHDSKTIIRPVNGIPQLKEEQNIILSGPPTTDNVFKTNLFEVSALPKSKKQQRLIKEVPLSSESPVCEQNLEWLKNNENRNKPIKALRKVSSTAVDPAAISSQNGLNENTKPNGIIPCNISTKLEPSWITNYEFNEPVKCDTIQRSNLHCEFCGFKFNEEAHLQLHKNLVHSKILEQTGTNTIFPCHLCSKKFQKRGSLMVHFRVVHYGFPNKIERTSDADVSAGFLCTVCNKVFVKQQHLLSHMKTHENKQWECDVCSKMFTTKYFLKKHKRLHTGEMPYHCGQCNKAFTFQQSYHKHMLYHSSEKPHTCNQCGRSFKELSTLHNHERIHSGERPFSCETCGKCFRQRVSCLVHRRIHTGAMPYQCTACGKKFRYKVSQRTHKCPSQPPGTVVRQDEGLLQKLLNNSKENLTSSTSPSTSLISPQEKHLQTESTPVEISNDFQITDCARQTEVSSQDLEYEEPNENSDAAVDVIKNTDFFSLVMSPLSVPSPTDKLQKLCLSSVEESSYVPSLSPTQTDMFNSNQNFELNYPSDMRSDTLETINEESLKQLLYGQTDGL